MLTPKFIRAHIGSMNSTRNALSYMLKMTHEFWGFCVNGDNDLTGTISNAKGFATGGINMPVGFENGFLHASGSDGVTAVGTQFFSSSTGNFTGSIAGKWLVAWKSGSISTDDSIYEVLQVVSPTVLRVNTFHGATPLSSSNMRPYFTDRTNVNYRVVDIGAASRLTFVSGNNLVLTVPGASDVNPGSARCQVHLGLNFTSTNDGALSMTLSPSGTWNGTNFTDGRGFSSFYIDVGGSQQLGGSWGSKTVTAQGSFVLIGASDFLLLHCKGVLWDTSTTSADSAGFMFEIPQRLYPANVDPNLIAGQTFIGILTTNDVSSPQANTGGFNSWRMVGQDGQLRIWKLLVRGIANGSNGWSSSNNTLFQSYLGSISPRFTTEGHNQYLNTVPFVEAVYSLTSVSTQYSLARARVRRFRLSPNTFQRNVMAGDSQNNMWYHLIDTVWIPWDGTRIPGGLFPLGE